MRSASTCISALTPGGAFMPVLVVCVLGAPKVFLSGVKGQWLFPDEMETNALRAVCQDCPSGAIQYIPKGDTAPEAPPPVNIVNIREDGPYGFRAPLEIGGEMIGFRATLCRCGASNNKPFCDGSHKGIGFRATGEPETRKSEALEVRDGPLEIQPPKNGPLQVTGNLEICAGTNRNVDRVTSVRLCRCGGSIGPNLRLYSSWISRFISWSLRQILCGVQQIGLSIKIAIRRSPLLIPPSGMPDCVGDSQAADL